jgi:hypothetical protein
MTHQPFRTDVLFDGGGEMNMPRDRHTVNTLTATSGSILFTPFIAARSEAITKVRVRVGTVAAATVTTIKCGIYEVNQAGNFTLIAITANTTTMAATINAAGTLTNLTTTFSKIANRLYATAFIFVGTTAPTLLGGNGTVFTSTAANNPYSLMPVQGALRRTGMTDLTTPQALSAMSIVSGQVAPYMEMLP